LPDESVAFPFNLLRIPASNDAAKVEEMVRVGGRRRSVRVRGRFRTDSAAAAHAAVAGGLGLGLAPLWQIRCLVDDGVVEVILEEFETAKIPIHVVWPPAKFPPAQAKLFTEFLAERLKGARF
jgi:DNA-binding transcriptional LysR family regulator